MASELLRIKKRKETRQEMISLYEKSDQVLLIHYSCESFYDIKYGRTPRVTSIAVRNLKTAQTESFSVPKIAERSDISINDIPARYDELEKKMLEEFFEFIKYRQTFHFVHWNMRDGAYGFSAIEHRFQALGGDPYKIQDDKKTDLARALISLFGRQYVGHSKAGRFLAIVELNKITDKDALTGKEEADAFEAGEYVQLHRSTLRKIDCMSNLFVRNIDGSLISNASLQDQYGFHPKALIEYVRDHWLWSVVVIIAIISGLVGKIAGLF